MPKIKLTVAMSGHQSWHVGDIYECDEAEAARLIAAERAVPIVEPKKETATKAKVAKETR